MPLPMKRFQKSISTGDLLNTKQKDEVNRMMHQSGVNILPPLWRSDKGQQDTSGDFSGKESIAISDTESNSESQRGRFIKAVLHPSSEIESPSSDTGEGVVFITPRQLEAREYGESSSSDLCLAQDLRKLNRSVTELMVSVGRHSLERYSL
jgi:hypothetical protein